MSIMVGGSNYSCQNDWEKRLLSWQDKRATLRGGRKRPIKFHVNYFIRSVLPQKRNNYAGSEKLLPTFIKENEPLWKWVP